MCMKQRKSLGIFSSNFHILHSGCARKKLRCALTSTMTPHHHSKKKLPPRFTMSENLYII